MKLFFINLNGVFYIFLVRNIIERVHPNTRMIQFLNSRVVEISPRFNLKMKMRSIAIDSNNFTSIANIANQIAFRHILVGGNQASRRLAQMVVTGHSASVTLAIKMFQKNSIADRVNGSFVCGSLPAIDANYAPTCCCINRSTLTCNIVYPAVPTINKLRTNSGIRNRASQRETVASCTAGIGTRFHERENLIIIVSKSHPLQRRSHNSKVQITLCQFQTIYATETYSRFQRNNGILVRGRVQVPNDTIGIFGVLIQGIPTATALKNNSHLVITAIAFECPTLIGVVRAGVHCDFFAVVDHVVFMVTVQIYVFAATIVINFIVVIILKSHFIFSYSFLFVPRQKLV